MRDALLAPRRIISGHLMDQGLQLRRDRRLTRLRFPAPEEPEALAMPAEKRGGLHNGQRPTPVEPTAQLDPGKASRVSSTAWFNQALLIEGKLFTQKEVFCGQSHRWT